MSEYLLDSTIWSVGGLFLGYILGKLENRVEAAIHKIEHLEVMLEEMSNER